VHRAIVCGQSGFFSAACRSNFKASNKLTRLKRISTNIYSLRRHKSEGLTYLMRTLRSFV